MSRIGRASWRHPEWGAAGVAAAGWALVLAAAVGSSAANTHVHHTDAGTGGQGGVAAGWLTGAVGWPVMCVAMMVPAALPAVRHVALTGRWNRRQRGAAIFLASYLAVWSLFGLVALAAIDWVRGDLHAGNTALLAAALVAAAAWQLTPSKRRSLRACHLIAPIPPSGLRADAACAAAGLGYGRRCVASCWALMLTMAVAGHASMLLMVLVTSIVVTERVAVRGTRLGGPTAIALLGAAGLVLTT